MRELLDTASRKASCPACGAFEIEHGFGPACQICGSQLKPQAKDFSLLSRAGLVNAAALKCLTEIEETPGLK